MMISFMYIGTNKNMVEIFAKNTEYILNNKEIY